MPPVSPLTQSGTVVCRLPGSGKRWGLFTDPCEIVVATRPDQVRPALRTVEQRLTAGCYAAGFVAYEAATAFDPAMTARPASGPLLWFGIYAKPPHPFRCRAAAREMPGLRLSPQIDFAAYAERIARIKDYLAKGDIYQTNFTIRTDASGPDLPPPEELFETLFHDHPTPFAAFVNTGESRMVSLSPELFLNRRGRRLSSSPMKGTARREPQPEHDLAVAAGLAADAKNRAENLMIVDMVRNDFGRVCRPGSIRVRPLFRVDTYATVHQMISTVHGELSDRAGLEEIFAAAFPAASITGAPKIRAMEVIGELEEEPRGIYTGSIGCAAPDGDFLFNVAIRTLEFQHDRCRLGIGGGIVADSTAPSEWQECLLKSSFASRPREPEFRVLETMLHRPGHGIDFLEEHLRRASRSQRYFGRPWREAAIRRQLEQLAFSAKPARVRMTVAATGKADFTVTPLEAVGWKRSPARLIMAGDAVDRHDVFSYHKTTRRELYDHWHHLALEANCDEAVFRNQDGEITEGGICNILVKINGRWYTPPLSSGLLDGIWRRHAIVEYRAEEKVLCSDDLLRAEQIVIGNSVRGATAAVMTGYSA